MIEMPLEVYSIIENFYNGRKQEKANSPNIKIYNLKNFSIINILDKYHIHLYPSLFYIFKFQLIIEDKKKLKFRFKSKFRGIEQIQKFENFLNNNSTFLFELFKMGTPSLFSLTFPEINLNYFLKRKNKIQILNNNSVSPKVITEYFNNQLHPLVKKIKGSIQIDIDPITLSLGNALSVIKFGQLTILLELGQVKLTPQFKKVLKWIFLLGKEQELIVELSKKLISNMI